MSLLLLFGGQGVAVPRPIYNLTTSGGSPTLQTTGGKSDLQTTGGLPTITTQGPAG